MLSLIRSHSHSPSSTATTTATVTAMIQSLSRSLLHQRSSTSMLSSSSSASSTYGSHVRYFGSKEERKKEQEKMKELTSGEKQGVNLGKEGTTTDTSKKPDVRHPHDEQEGEKELRNPGKSPLDQHEPGTIDPNIQRKPYSTYTRVNSMYNHRWYHTNIYRHSYITRPQRTYVSTTNDMLPAADPSEQGRRGNDNGFVGYTEDGRILTTKRPSAKNPNNKSGYAQSVSRERFRQEEEEHDRTTYGDELEDVYEKTRTRPPTRTQSH